jgi:hypothetical protein
MDALLVTLASVEVYGSEERGELFELDSAVTVLENAAADLSRASEDERQRLVQRAHQLAAKSNDPRRTDFLENIGEYLGLGEDEN